MGSSFSKLMALRPRPGRNTPSTSPDECESVGTYRMVSSCCSPDMDFRRRGSGLELPSRVVEKKISRNSALSGAAFPFLFACHNTCKLQAAVLHFLICTPLISCLSRFRPLFSICSGIFTVGVLVMQLQIECEFESGASLCRPFMNTTSRSAPLQMIDLE